MTGAEDEKMRILVNSNSNMSRGKYAAAAVHAALTAAGVHPGLPVIVLGGQRDDVLRCATIIRDAGKTEVEPGTPTAGTDWCPTPPADDVREALDRVIRRHWVATPGEFRNALLAAFAVRPHGTVTAAEGPWEYGVRHVAVDGWPTERVHVSLEDAQADLDTCGMNCHLIRRRGAQSAGEWHPIDQTGEPSS